MSTETPRPEPLGAPESRVIFIHSRCGMNHGRPMGKDESCDWLEQAEAAELLAETPTPEPLTAIEDRARFTQITQEPTP
jgi:hypothetical protein